MAASEAGGITQGMGAYKVQVPFDGKPQTCVFLDTPGHEVINDVALVLTFNCLFMQVFFFFFKIFMSNALLGDFADIS